MAAVPMLSKDAFQNEKSRKLFEAIDELRGSGIASDIDLPELVIVGDQSAGKSSLLQSLTNIPFPVASRLCTRFPTRIISRRTKGSVETTKISIEKAYVFGGDPQENERYANFTQIRPNITSEEFEQLILEAAEVMGVAMPAAVASQDRLKPAAAAGEKATSLQPLASLLPKKNFSKDVLKIEISGSKRSHFSIVDCPGLFHTLTKELKEGERQEVRDIVSSYMSATRSIIVCVANGLTDLANQVAFDMALAPQHDPEGERMVGVITKCDISQSPNDIIELAQNKEKHLRHGWFVVRNRTPTEASEGMDSEQRHQKESQFFSTEPWVQLPQDRRGTEALKSYLSNLLSKQIREAFPLLLKEIHARAKASATILDDLGLSRDSLEKKRNYMVELAQTFSDKARAALDGRYQTEGVLELRIRLLVRNLNDDFATNMKLYGHYLPFENPKKSGIATRSDGLFRHTSATLFPTAPKHAAGSQPVNLAFGAFSANTNGVMNGRVSPSNAFGSSGAPGPLFGDSSASPSKSSILVGSAGTTVRLDPFVNPSNIYEWIRRTLADNRGTELPGTLNSAILPVLFRKQADKWKDIAGQHFSRIRRTTVSSMTAMLAHTCVDDLTRSKVERIINDANKAAMKRGVDRLEALNKDVLDRPLQTSDSAFEESVRAARLARFKNALERFASFNKSDSPDQPTDQLILKIRDQEALFNELHISNARNLEDEVHDILEAYYNLAIKKYIENVNEIVVQRYLDDANGPVLQFSPRYIVGLNDAQIEELAAEHENVVVRRQREERTLANLRRAEEIAEKYS